MRARLQSLDESLSAPLTLPRGPSAARAMGLLLAHSGDSYIWGGLMVAAWFLGDHPWKVRALVCVIGLVLVEVIVIVLKTVIRRPRPPGDSGRIYRRADPFSFPSGHAARAVMLCVLAWQLGPAAAIAAISAWSPFMVLARIAIGIHYVFDVAAGLLLGGILTMVVLRLVPLVAERV